MRVDGLRPKKEETCDVCINFKGLNNECESAYIVKYTKQAFECNDFFDLLGET